MALGITELARLREMCRNGHARLIREGAGISLSEVGDRIDNGLPPTTIHRWETGQRMPRGRHAEQYWRLLRRLQVVADEGRARTGGPG